MVHLLCKNPGGRAIKSHSYSEYLLRKGNNCSGAGVSPHCGTGKKTAESLGALTPTYWPDFLSLAILIYSHQVLGLNLKIVRCSCGMTRAGNSSPRGQCQTTPEQLFSLQSYSGLFTSLIKAVGLVPSTPHASATLHLS